MRVRIVLVLVVAAILAAAFYPAAYSQKPGDTDQLALAVADAQKANQARIMKYSWQVESTLSMSGEEKAKTISEMRFNSEGKIDATPMGGESSIEKKRGVRGRRQEKKMDEMGEYLQNVLDQSFQYIFLSKGTLVDIFDRAKINETEKSIEVSAVNLFVKSDSLFMSVDPKTKLTQKLTFRTMVGQDTVNGAVVFKALNDGPSTPATFEFDIPSQTIKITAETYNWTAQE